MNQMINLDPGRQPEADSQQSGGTCHITMTSVTATAPLADFVELVDPAVLVDCVDEEVGHFCQSSEVPEDFSAQEPNRRELLGVLTFAYARRVYDSEEIAHRCQTEALFQRLCNGHTPFTSELIRFRRHYRPLLVTVLANVMMRVSETVLNELKPASKAALKRQLLCQATARLDTARHLDSESE